MTIPGCGHCTHRQVPDSALKLLLDLGSLQIFIEGRLSSYPQCEVIPAGDLLAAKHGASPSEVLAADSGWGAVHGSGGAYARMALTLVDKVLGGTFKQPQPSRRLRTAAANESGPNPALSPGASTLTLPPAATTAWTTSLVSLAAVTAAAPGAGRRASTKIAPAAAAPAPPATSAITSQAKSSGGASGGRSGGSGGYKSRY